MNMATAIVTKTQFLSSKRLFFLVQMDVVFVSPSNIRMVCKDGEYAIADQSICLRSLTGLAMGWIYQLSSGE